MDPFVLSQLTEPKDEIDHKIHSDFMGMYMLNEISRKQVEFKFNDENKTAGKVYQLWLNTGICLLKANAHWRNFNKLLEEKRAEFDNEVKANPDGSIQHYYWDLSVEVEGMLTQLKAALDSFAVLIGTASGVGGIRGWSKTRPTGETTEYSGQNIINVLTRNLPAADIEKYQDLINIIGDNKEQLTNLVKARDKFTHPHESFMDFSSGFYYDATKKEIIEPAIRYGDVAYIQSTFVRMTFNLVFDVLVYSGITLLNGLALGMALGKNEDEYVWGIINITQESEPTQ